MGVVLVRADQALITAPPELAAVLAVAIESYVAEVWLRDRCRVPFEGELRRMAEQLRDVGETLGDPTSGTVGVLTSGPGVPSGWLTVTDAAHRLDLDRSYVLRLLRSGRLVGRKVHDRMWVVDPGSVAEYDETRSRDDRAG